MFRAFASPRVPNHSRPRPVTPRQSRRFSPFAIVCAEHVVPDLGGAREIKPETTTIWREQARAAARAFALQLLTAPDSPSSEGGGALFVGPARPGLMKHGFLAYPYTTYVLYSARVAAREERATAPHPIYVYIF